MGVNNSLPAGWSLRDESNKGSLIDRVLRGRGVSTKEEKAIFLQPDFYRDTNDPWLLPDVKVAVDRLVKARAKGELVGIFGDYDADGIPATAVMVRGLRGAGFKEPKAYIPSRDSGYGLVEDALSLLHQDGVKVLITVDTGITAHQMVLAANKLGIEVIITDHHEVVGDLPAALAVVDPKRADNQYPNIYLAGTAVGYKLLWALYDELSEDHNKLKWLVDLVGLATIADMVQLNTENRALATVGLTVLAKTKNAGLKALMQVAGIDYAKVTERDVAYALAPRINAISRLGKDGGDISNNPVLQLLTTDDDSLALRLAAAINLHNAERQSSVTDLSEEAWRLAQPIKEGGTVLFIPQAQPGLTGLIAGKIADRSGWPALVMTEHNGEVRGSGRSPTSLSLVDLLTEQSEHLSRFGGHKQAAGWSLVPENLEVFTQAVSAQLAKLAALHPQGGLVKLDAALQPGEATVENAQALTKLAPFGMGNAEPLFLWQDEVVSITKMGPQRNHWRIATKSSPADIVYFAVPAHLSEPVPGSIVSLAVSLEVNSYRGAAAQLRVRHYHVS